MCKQQNNLLATSIKVNTTEGLSANFAHISTIVLVFIGDSDS